MTNLFLKSLDTLRTQQQNRMLGAVAIATAAGSRIICNSSDDVSHSRSLDQGLQPKLKKVKGPRLLSQHHSTSRMPKKASYNEAKTDASGNGSRSLLLSLVSV
ncbi:unnamed protein product [Cercospora beticola]|nr:unnamed protein product [Cercospora beticola]